MNNSQVSVNAGECSVEHCQSGEDLTDTDADRVEHHEVAWITDDVDGKSNDESGQEVAGKGEL